MRDCPPPEQLTQFLAGRLDDAEEDALCDHVEECRHCQDLLETLVGGAASRNGLPPTGPQPSPSMTFLKRLRETIPPGAWPVRLRDTSTPAGPEDTVQPDSGRLASRNRLKPPPLPGYEILGELGRGGMGVVYKARQLPLNRLTAVKMILAGPHASAEARVRFQAEAEASAALQHPHIVQVYEIGEHEGHPFFSMEYVAGGTLKERMGGLPQPAPDAARLILTLARAVQYAHDKGIIHRDLKPSNILLQKEELSANPSPAVSSWLPKIADFGLAKRLDDGQQTRRGRIMGTPSYMAPEQASGQGGLPGPAADVYALGAILYELLTGRPPFVAESWESTLDRILHAEPVAPRRLRPRCPRDLETICLKCLDKEPRRRYASALALADDLGRFLNGQPIHARPVGPLAWAWKWLRRRPVPTIVGTAIIVMVLLGADLMGRQWRLAEARARRAEKEAEALRELVEREQQRIRLLSAQLALERGIRLGQQGQTEPITEMPALDP